MAVHTQRPGTSHLAVISRILSSDNEALSNSGYTLEHGGYFVIGDQYAGLSKEGKQDILGPELCAGCHGTAKSNCECSNSLYINFATGQGNLSSDLLLMFSLLD